MADAPGPDHRSLARAMPFGEDVDGWLIPRLIVGAVTVSVLAAALLVGMVHAFVASRLTGRRSPDPGS